jgi:hypothetical protein
MSYNPQPFPVDQVHQLAGIVRIHARNSRNRSHVLHILRIGHIQKLHRLRRQWLSTQKSANTICDQVDAVNANQME